MSISTLILQSTSSAEIRACLKASLLSSASIEVVRAELFDLDRHSALLRAGRAMPVGSVEFVRDAMQVAGVDEPEGISYPEPLRPFLGRDVFKARAGSVLGRWFVKPVRTKVFNGFVFDTRMPRTALSVHDVEQYDAFMAIPERELVWLSDPVEFKSEWRYYVRGKRIVASARYDDQPDEAPTPDESVVQQMVAALPFDHPCAVDAGVLESGQTVLVEVNDAWALGLYGNCMPEVEYLDFLAERWASIAPSRCDERRVA